VGGRQDEFSVSTVAREAWARQLRENKLVQRALQNSPHLQATFEYMFTLGVSTGGVLVGQMAQAQLSKLQEQKEQAIHELFDEEEAP